MRSKHAAWIAALALLAMGCHDGPTTPPPPSVDLDLRIMTTSDAPGAPVTIIATIANSGRDPLFHWGGCGGRVRFTLLDPDGRRVAPYWDGPLPACPDYFPERLLPGAQTDDGMGFDGVLADAHAMSYKAPRGTYTVVACFDYWMEPTFPQRTPPLILEKRATFSWNPVNG